MGREIDEIMKWNSLKVRMCVFATILTFGATIAVGQNLHASANMDKEQYAKLEATLGMPPVDAKVDRVWHAIPGLAGWKINVSQSAAKTKVATDGKLHLVWESSEPKVHLENLPPEPIYRGPKEEKSVCLMVNVSWGEEYVPALLKVLANNHVKATFFLDGAWVKKQQDLARKIVEDGHAIGSHGFGHPDFRKLSDTELTKQVVSTRDMLYRELGTEVKCIAPPSGSYDRRLVKIAKDQRMYAILWTADTLDWQHPNPNVILERVRKNLAPGVLILMHPTAQTVEALPNIIRVLRNSGYQMKTVDAVVTERPVTKPPAVLSVGR